MGDARGEANQPRPQTPRHWVLVGVVTNPLQFLLADGTLPSSIHERLRVLLAIGRYANPIAALIGRFLCLLLVEANIEPCLAYGILVGITLPL